MTKIKVATVILRDNRTFQGFIKKDNNGSLIMYTWTETTIPWKQIQDIKYEDDNEHLLGKLKKVI